MRTIVQQFRRAAGDLGPYLLVDLLLPGGSLIALLMWVYRRHRKAAQFKTISD